jgi:hypothetical protein
MLRGQLRYMNALFEGLCESSGPVKELEEVAYQKEIIVLNEKIHFLEF